MAKHYLYRMDHDKGFAPHVSRGVCTLCGCKKTTVEAWAKPGSWIIGIGGKGTGRPDALIYMLKVEANPTLAEFRRNSPTRAAYLAGWALKPAAKVLVGRHFYYFGNNAVPLPANLAHLNIRAQGCKTVAEEDVVRLDAYLARRFGPGVHGQPNNPELPRAAGAGTLAGSSSRSSAGCACHHAGARQHARGTAHARLA
jgi:hypothetical protein